MRSLIRISHVFVFLGMLVVPILAQEERREIGNLTIEGIPEIPESVVERMRQYQNTRSASFRDWAPDGEGMLIGTRFAETTQFHFVKKPGGARHQLTFFSEPVGGGSFCPDSTISGFLFSKDIGGGEAYQIFFFNTVTGQSTLLTDGKSRNSGGDWSNRGDRFAYTSTKRNEKDHDIYVADIENPDRAVCVMQEGGAWGVREWSPDDTRLLVGRYVSINESYLYILDVESGALEQINPSDKKIAYGGAQWAKDGKGIYLTSDEASEFHRLRYYDLEKKDFTVLTGDIPWDVESVEISDRGDRLAFTVNENGVGRLYLLDMQNRRYRKVPGIPMGQIYGLDFHPDGDRLAVVINTPRSPGDIYVLHLQDDSLARWTVSEVGGLDTGRFVEPEPIEYETFDTVDGKPRKIPAFYYKPSKGEGPFPVLVNIHGGPEGQYTPYFSFSTQYFLNELGIAVIGPNVRGSAGYGKSYLLLDNGFKREDTVKDIGKLLDWIETRPELDASRVAVIGGSYGGYMVLAAMTHFNDRIRACIDIVGISNFVTFLENTKDYRRDLRRTEYGDERDPQMREFLEKISPNNHAEKITKPIFIAQGQNDPRVPVTEAEQMVAEIRKNGGDVWYLLAKDEGHGFRKKTNRDFYYNATVLFLQKHLLK